jgi:hypothetical protein
MRETRSSSPYRFEQTRISKLSNQMSFAKIVGLLHRVGFDASNKMWGPVQGGSQKIHQWISKIGRHRLLRPTLRVLLVVDLVCSCRTFLLSQSATVCQGDWENKSNYIVGGISHCCNQIWRQKVSVFFYEICRVITNIPGEMTNHELKWVTIICPNKKVKLIFCYNCLYSNKSMKRWAVFEVNLFYKALVCLSGLLASYWYLCISGNKLSLLVITSVKDWVIWFVFNIK